MVMSWQEVALACYDIERHLMWDLRTKAEIFN